MKPGICSQNQEVGAHGPGMCSSGLYHLFGSVLHLHESQFTFLLFVPDQTRKEQQEKAPDGSQGKFFVLFYLIFQNGNRSGWLCISGEDTLV